MVLSRWSRRSCRSTPSHDGCAATGLKSRPTAIRTSDWASFTAVVRLGVPAACPVDIDDLTDYLASHYSGVAGSEVREGLAKVISLARFREALYGTYAPSGDRSGDPEAESETAGERSSS